MAELCCECHEPTGRDENGLYIGEVLVQIGPLCLECWEDIQQYFWSQDEPDLAKAQGRIEELQTIVDKLQFIVVDHDRAWITFKRCLDRSIDPLRLDILEKDVDHLLDRAKRNREAAEAAKGVQNEDNSA